LSEQQLKRQKPAKSYSCSKLVFNEIGRNQSAAGALLDLAFFVFDMLARYRVVFANDHLLGHGTRVFLGHVEMACSRRGVQTNLDRGWLGHWYISCCRRIAARAASKPEPRLLPLRAGVSTVKAALRVLLGHKVDAARSASGLVLRGRPVSRIL